MPRKFVTGDDRHVTVKVKRENVNAKCQGCGADMVIPNTHVGDILCPKCMKSSSYSLEYVDGEPNKDGPDS